jgi:hypothetical protein
LVHQEGLSAERYPIQISSRGLSLPLLHFLGLLADILDYPLALVVLYLSAEAVAALLAAWWPLAAVEVAARRPVRP